VKTEEGVAVQTITRHFGRLFASASVVLGLLAGSLVPTAGFMPSVPLAGPVRPLSSPTGHGAHSQTSKLNTANWSGYAVASYQTGQSYTAATASWKVPSVSAPPGSSTGYSASWVGVGGFCQNSTCLTVDQTLIQIGTSQNVTANGPQYGAWYETTDSGGPVAIPLTISPGDTIQASLSMSYVTVNSVPEQDWTLTMTDQSSTGSNTWTGSVYYTSSLASAEWIEEAPLSVNGSQVSVLPLADFGTVTFDPGMVNAGANPRLNAGTAIVMYDPTAMRIGSQQTANPSAPDSDTDGFNVCWGAGKTLTKCPAPAS
jgi:hypothetical protein